MRTVIVSAVKRLKMEANTMYVVLKSTYCILSKEVEVYGAALIEKHGQDFSIIEVFPDLASQKEKVLDFVTKCNAMSLSQVHFRDAVVDFLIE